MTISSNEEFSLGFLALIVALAVRRMIPMLRGTPVSEGRLVAFAVFYVVLFVLVVGASALILPLWSFAIDAALVVVAALAALPFAERNVRFERRADGAWYYRLGPLLPIVYLVLFGVRLGADAVFLNANPFSPTPPTAPTTFALAVLLTVDGLFAISTGLLLGRSLGVFRAYRRQAAAASVAGSSPAPPLP